MGKNIKIDVKFANKNITDCFVKFSLVSSPYVYIENHQLKVVMWCRRDHAIRSPITRLSHSADGIVSGRNLGAL